ncbi:homocysteine S-methyltransferase family protein [Lentzea sp. BCCO 10_0856]|uniref:Homocysteine S-methyltransferase family protein n=1 Tax=Lentzea miocenica TaxID=3095431 RepID=A0ABU4T7M1_9PSEU|nr:homocysteine S-methyltransferase family protein [Lentzea sp. BCCO 10_0856]MDX8034153.1 homocysteine S-methyltransferase family protein [Lentzea sp. BCCO 10_0856]
MTGPVWLDGGVATELRRAGLAVRAPWWTTRALLTDANRTVLRGIHERFVTAGARVITAATFRCNLRALRANGLDAAGLGWMVHAAVGVAQAARLAADVPGVEVAGSMAPVEDCYRPDLVPPDDDLRTEHRWLATELSRARADLVLVETMNTTREAVIAVEEVRAAGLRAWVSFVCEGTRLLSGEDLAAAARLAESAGAEAVLVNCTTPADTTRCLETLAGNGPGVFGGYPNLEDRSGVPQWTDVDEVLPSSATPEEFAASVRYWVEELGASVVGGCCGCTPEHLAAAVSVVPSVGVRLA